VLNFTETKFNWHLKSKFPSPSKNMQTKTTRSSVGATRSLHATSELIVPDYLERASHSKTQFQDTAFRMIAPNQLEARFSSR
jgi:hypothetical protein